MLSIETYIIVSVIKTVIALFVLLTAVAYCVWLERKVVGHIQNRWGPTRVGPFGLLQPLADGMKFLFKEESLPQKGVAFMYYGAPVMALIPGALAFASPACVSASGRGEAWLRTAEG